MTNNKYKKEVNFKTNPYTLQIIFVDILLI
jgi:hypothetical protein